MSELPSSWIKVPLKECANINMGQSPEGAYVSENKEGLPFYQGKAEFGKTYPTPRKFCTKPTKIAQKNDILLSIRAPVGPTNLCPDESCIGRGLAGIRADYGVSQQYLLNYFKHIEPWLSQQGTGSTFKAISGGFLSDVEVLIAPENEQIRIADKLDSVLAKVDAAQARLEKIPTLLKRFRQSVLAAATSGELTREWRDQQGKHWESKFLKISDIAKEEKYSLGIGPFGSNLKVDDYRNSGHPLVFVRDIRAQKFGHEKTVYIEKTKFDELLAHRASPGDLLITKMGDPPGDLAIYPDNMPEAVITADCIKLRVNEKILVKEYVAISLRSKYFQDQILAITAGVAQQKVNLKKFKELEILVIPLEEQTEIVRRVESLFAQADAVEQQYRAAKQRLDRLSQSLLAKAFRGELVPQDPNDEPATELLKRIQAERTALTTTKRQRQQPV